MRTEFDWKFLLTLVVAVVGVVAPIAIWYADQSTRALRVNVVSTAALGPKLELPVSGLRVIIDELEVPSPHSIVIDLSNSGTRPLHPADFEGPIELLVSGVGSVMRADVVSVSPADLRPSVALKGGVVAIQPLLMNPGDNVRIAALTAGGPPTVQARARIAGISKVNVTSEPERDSERARRLSILSLVVGFALTIVYFISGGRIGAGLRGRGVGFEPWFVAMASGFGSAALLLTARGQYSFAGIDAAVYAGVAGGVIGAFCMARVARRELSRVTGARPWP